MKKNLLVIVFSLLSFLAAAQVRFETINAQLEHAKTMNSYAGLIFVAIGIMVVAISAWMLLPKAELATKY